MSNYEIQSKPEATTPTVTMSIFRESLSVNRNIFLILTTNVGNGPHMPPCVGHNTKKEAVLSYVMLIQSIFWLILYFILALLQIADVNDHCGTYKLQLTYRFGYRMSPADVMLA
jgi:hypothetical protein